MSRKKRNNPLDQPPVEIIRGAQLIAEYLPQEVPEFRDNPLNEAIPPTFDPSEVIDYLFQLPPYSDEDREKSAVARLHMTETAREFFVPNGKHLIAYYAITNMIRRGYIRRNPVLWGYWKQQHNNIESFLKALKDKPFPNSRARGLAIVGSGGTGKSTTVEKILQSLPQLITHVSYKGRDFIQQQLVWLKFDCPRNGSLRELCVHFFRAVDEIIETNYSKYYAGGSYQTLEGLIAGMARVAANHCLGIIVLDEIQDLSEARSGGASTMISFFVHLENAIGVPFALIGTQDAIPLLSGQFRQARRVSEQGDIAWDRMSEVEPEIEEFEDDEDDDDDEGALVASAEPHAVLSTEDKKKPQADLVWKSFVETLWIYQYVKHPKPLNQNVLEDKRAHALYRVSKGIPAVVQTVFVLAQQRAIITGEEKISARLIRDTVRDNQKLIQGMLGEARMKKTRQKPPVGDLEDLDIVYESHNVSYIPSDKYKGNETKNVKEDVESNNASNKAQPKQQKAATTSKASHGQKKLDIKADETGKMAAHPRESPLAKKEEHPRSMKVSAQAKSGDSRKKDKYNKSPAEYIKGE
jgi:hypothetical protein